MRMPTHARFPQVLASVLAWSFSGAAMAAEHADLIVTHARIYTADRAHRIVAAVASRNGKFIYVGAAAGVEALRGPGTRTIDAGGGLILPGLVDSHIHPLGIVELDGCDLKNRSVTLAELSAFAADCLRRLRIPAGDWLTVEEWNFSAGNTPDAQLTTLRAAIDRASMTHPIQLRGNDGHHGAFNSAALARAVDTSGKTVGYSNQTLAAGFERYRGLIGVDDHGAPNGTVDEEAREPLGLPASRRLAQLMEAPERVVDALTSRGILLVQDAAARADSYALYEALAARGKLTLRVNTAQYFPPNDFRTPRGTLDVSLAVRAAMERRRRYAGNAKIRADAVKIFVDGVLEGDPKANPPSLPNAARTRAYLQPRFARDSQGALRVTGYVDPAPGQRVPSRGLLILPRPELFAWASGFHEAGFTLHFHAIGDDAVRAAIDAVEFARNRDGVATQPDTIAHAQLVDPRDAVRLGRDHLFVAYTFAWMNTDPDYDMTVIPFIDRVSGGGNALHKPNFYYERNAYAARTIKNAGATLIAGSDAPVDTRDPRPFVNMERALTRRAHGLPPLNPGEALDLADVLDAYTIDGARALGRADETGSIEVGKSADFILLDQDIVRLAQTGAADRIGQTAVLNTWFQGQLVYSAANRAPR
ncbi:MAG TPA: amidohydrolase family protein [Steroidobacteraceae bacterium]